MNYINGSWIPGRGRPFTSINPADGTTVWEGQIATEWEVVSAWEAAQKAFQDWRRMGFKTRLAFIEQFGARVKSRTDDLARLISKEAGKPLWEARTEVASVTGKIPLSAKACEERTPEKKSIDSVSNLRHKPLGVAAVLGPFNFPAHLSNGHIVPALLTGNTVIYKPSGHTPAVAEWIVRCWEEAGLPPGVLNLIQGDGSSARLILKQPIQLVCFTGSYQTGQNIHASFKDRPDVLLALEMGGNNPLIIDTHDDMQPLIYPTLLSTLISAGQRCTCARRVFIPDNEFGQSFLNGFVETVQKLKIGPYTDEPEPFMGPVIHPDEASGHLEAWQELLRIGGKAILTMSRMKENTGFLSPGILDMTDANNPPDEEIFAPLVQIYRYKTFEEALELAGDTQYGLTAALFSPDLKRYQQFYQHMDTGVINWNRPTTGASSALPFGGTRHSGNHRPSGYFAADYCSTPVAEQAQPRITAPAELLPGVDLS